MLCTRLKKRGRSFVRRLLPSGCIGGDELWLMKADNHEI